MSENETESAGGNAAKSVSRNATRGLRPKDAATLILLRNGGAGLEVLMGRRSRRQVFMPDQYVFPGGGVEPCDRWVRPAGELRAEVAGRLARSCSRPRARALAAAAIRETFEETGLMLAARAPPSRGRARAAVRPEWRPFHDAGLAPSLDRLDYVYRAVTPPGQKRRFNARFFLAEADRLAGVLGGNGELLDLRWVAIGEAAALPIPQITGLVLEEVERLLRDGGSGAESAPVPVCKRVRGRHAVVFE